MLSLLLDQRESEFRKVRDMIKEKIRQRNRSINPLIVDTTKVFAQSRSLFSPRSTKTVAKKVAVRDECSMGGDCCVKKKAESLKKSRDYSFLHDDDPDYHARREAILKREIGPEDRARWFKKVDSDGDVVMKNPALMSRTGGAGDRDRPRHGAGGGGASESRRPPTPVVLTSTLHQKLPSETNHQGRHPAMGKAATTIVKTKNGADRCGGESKRPPVVYTFQEEPRKPTSLHAPPRPYSRCSGLSLLAHDRKRPASQERSQLKRKVRPSHDDDGDMSSSSDSDVMEASFDEIMAEERRSSRIARREDLRELRLIKEEEEDERRQRRMKRSSSSKTRRLPCRLTLQ